MVILYIYSTCWRMKSVFYEHQHPPHRTSPVFTFVRGTDEENQEEVISNFRTKIKHQPNWNLSNSTSLWDWEGPLHRKGTPSPIKEPPLSDLPPTFTHRRLQTRPKTLSRYSVASRVTCSGWRASSEDGDYVLPLSSVGNLWIILNPDFSLR
jgi:hypothetical protein